MPEVAADPVADPVATAEPAAEPAVTAAETGSGDDVATLVAQVEAILAKLKSLMGAATDEEEMPTEDIVEGLQETSTEEGAQVSTDEEEPKPEMAQDAALRRFYADGAKKISFIPACRKWSARLIAAPWIPKQVAEYGVKKLGIKCEAGHEMTAVNVYLDGRSAGEKGKVAVTQRALDSKTNSSAEIDAYLKGVKKACFRQR